MIKVLGKLALKLNKTAPFLSAFAIILFIFLATEFKASLNIKAVHLIIVTMLWSVGFSLIVYFFGEKLDKEGDKIKDSVVAKLSKVAQVYFLVFCTLWFVFLLKFTFNAILM